MLYFIAGTHFGNENKINSGVRKFLTVDQMDYELIKAWNGRVQKSDTVVIVGDFSSYSAYKTLSIARRLNGKKYLAKTEKDEFVKDPEVVESKVFALIADTVNLRDPDTERWFYACHFPMLSWPGRTEGTLFVHGHMPVFDDYAGNGVQSSEGKFMLRDAFDVTADNNGFIPISAQTLIRRSQERNCTLIPKFMLEGYKG